MNSVDSLDLSALAQFKASSLLAEVDRSPNAAAGKPLQLEVLQIDFDVAQPRRTISEISIAELAQSIRLHGVLEPISVRSHAEIPGRYVVNRGERRLRACRMAGLDRVPAFLDERQDPYAQAAENLHREDMSPFDLAHFIAEREQEGQARAEIARRLGKPSSFITEAAALIDALVRLAELRSLVLGHRGVANESRRQRDPRGSTRAQIPGCDAAAYAEGPARFVCCRAAGRSHRMLCLARVDRAGAACDTGADRVSWIPRDAGVRIPDRRSALPALGHAGVLGGDADALLVILGLDEPFLAGGP